MNKLEENIKEVITIRSKGNKSQVDTFRKKISELINNVNSYKGISMSGKVTRTIYIDRKLHRDYEEYIKHSKKGALQYIADIAVGYDGHLTVEGLTGLIDEMKAVALLGLKQ